uniref:Uncharacterized protein n=1 Tax=Oryza meridionalis TaxID=40149 RepID=A0A0E0C4Z4_9ORYZ
MALRMCGCEGRETVPFNRAWLSDEERSDGASVAVQWQGLRHGVGDGNAAPLTCTQGSDASACIATSINWPHKIRLR